MKRALYLLLLPGFVLSICHGAPPPLGKAILEIRADIERDTQALADLRAEQAAARKGPAAQQAALERELARLRRTVEQRRRQYRHIEREQAALFGELAALEEQCRHLQALFTDYARGRATRASASEALRLDTFAPTEHLARSQSADDYDGLADGITTLLQQAADWNRRRKGGDIFESTALDAEGFEHSGSVISLGPAAFFMAQRGWPAGLTMTRPGTAPPVIHQVPRSKMAEALTQILEGHEAAVPIDVTSGDALRIREARTSWLEHLQQGGAVMIPLLAVGLAALLLAIWKTVALATTHVEAGDTLQQAMLHARSGHLDQANDHTTHLPQPLSMLARTAIEHRLSPREHLEEIMHEHVLSLLPDLERHLGTLAVLGGIAPLLGLLGTVTGMIHTFQLVTLFGSGDARMLSGGISEALITTQAGLLIAIPTLLAHAFLVRRARSLIATLERSAMSMINSLTSPDTAGQHRKP